jgi:micrococcal nuclease
LRHLLARAGFLILAGACDTSSGNASPPVSTPSETQSVVKRPIECRISRVADGDTVYCGNVGRIRLLMIDAPELSQGPPGLEAQRELTRIMPVGTLVRVETDVRERDTYGRILGYVYLPDGRMVNEEMARSGYVTALVYPPNVRHVEEIRDAVADARKAKRGLWATTYFDCSPRDYRAGRCGGGAPNSRNRRRQSPSS